MQQIFMGNGATMSQAGRQSKGKTPGDLAGRATIPSNRGASDAPPAGRIER
jgi:hypothetical protein